MAIAEHAIRRDEAILQSDAAVVAALALAALLGMLSATALSPFLPAIAADLGSSVGVLGQSLALLNLLAAALGLVVGPLADRLGSRRLLLIGLVAVAVSALASALATTMAVLLVAATIAALSRASIQPLAFAIAADRFEGTARRRAISWTQAGVSGSTLAGLPLLAGLAGVVGWRGALVSLALLALGVTLLQRQVLPAAAARPGRSVRLKDLVHAYAPLVRHRPTLGLVGATLLGQLGFWATLTYLGAFLIQVHGLPVSQVGGGYLAGGLGLLVGNILATGPLGRQPLRPLLIGMRLAQAPLLAGVLVLPDAGLGTMIGLTLLAGILHGASTALGMTLVVTESPAGRATTVTLNQSALTLGVAVASGLGGLLLALGSYEALGLSIPITCGAAALLLGGTRPRRVPTPMPSEQLEAAQAR